MSCVFLLGIILPGTLFSPWSWLTVSFPMFGKFLALMSSNIFSGPFSLLSFWDPYNVSIGVFRPLRLSSFSFILFPIFCSAAVISTILSSRSLICSSASVILLLIPSLFVL